LSFCGKKETSLKIRKIQNERQKLKTRKNRWHLWFPEKGRTTVLGIFSNESYSWYFLKF